MLTIVTLVVLMGAAFVSGYLLRAPDRQALADAADAIVVDAPVTLRTPPALIAEGSTEAGTVIEIAATRPPGALSTQVTAAPLAVGASVVPGAVLFAVADRPMIALQLTGPHFRDLVLGDEGDDVSALNVALAELGYGADPDSDTYTADTSDAVEAMYDDRGFDAAAAADSSSAAPTPTSTPAPTNAAAPEAADVPAAPVGPAAADPALADGSRMPYSEVFVLPPGSYTVATAPALYSTLAEGAAAITLRSPLDDVVARLDAAEIRTVAVGDRVHLTSRDSGLEGDGQIASIGEFIPATSGAEGEAAELGYDVTITIDEAVRPNFAPDSGVAVRFGDAGAARLAVPASALLQDGAQSYVIRVGGSTPARVDVKVDTVADGWALLSGGDLAEGDSVQVGA